MEKNQKSILTNLVIVLLILIILILSVVGVYAWAKYQTVVNGTTTAQVAKWSFKLVDGITETSDIIDFAFTRTDGYGKVAAGKLAPGTYGQFEIGLDARGTETILEYEINVALENKPRNLKLYSNSTKTEEIEVLSGKFTIDGFMSLEDVKNIKTVTIYWDWPYETGSISDDVIDTEDAGKDVTMQVSVTGTEVLEQSNKIEFTVDGTTYYAEEGMTWEEWIDSSYNTGNYVTKGDLVGPEGYEVCIDNLNRVNSTDVIYKHDYILKSNNAEIV